MSPQLSMQFLKVEIRALLTGRPPSFSSSEIISLKSPRSTHGRERKSVNVRERNVQRGKSKKRWQYYPHLKPLVFILFNFFFSLLSKKKIFPYYNNFPTQSRLHIIILYFFSTTLITQSARLDSTESRIHVLHFHARLDSTESRVHILFMGPTILFIHLKIILLQCFQFSVSVTISSI